MARVIHADDLTLLLSGRFQTHVQLWLENQAGAYVNTLDLAGEDHFVSIQWTDSVDQMVMSGSCVLMKKAGANSLVPLDEAAALNQYLGAYKPFIRVGQRIKLMLAFTAIGSAPVRWYNFFEGRSDEPDVGERLHIRLSFRDFGGVIADADIRDELTYPMQALETRIQEILDDTLGPGAITLYVPSATGQSVPAGTQPTGNLFEEIRKLARETGGFDLRYKWDEGTSAWRLTLWAPDLVSTTPAYVLTPQDHWFKVQDLKQNRDQVKNMVRVFHPSGYVDVSDPQSILDYGLRFTSIDSSPGVETAAQATAVGTAVVNDLKSPIWDHGIISSISPMIELRDVIGWGPTSDLYSVQKNWWVTALTHNLTSSELRSTIKTASRPVLVGRRTWESGTGVSGGDDGLVVENILTTSNGENLVAQLPGFNPEREYAHTEQVIIPMAWFSRILRAYDLLSGGMEINATNPSDFWRQRIEFYNASGTLIYGLDSMGNQSGGFWNGIGFWSVEIPNTCTEIRYGIKGFSSHMWDAGPAVGTAKFRYPRINRGRLSAPYAETETLRSATVRRAVTSATSTQALTHEAGAREGEAGVPGDPSSRTSSTKVKDSAGQLDLLDPVTRQILNLSAAASVTESSGRAINRLLAKALSSDADNLDYVPNGSTFGRTLLTALTSGQVDLSKAGVISKFLTELVRSSGDATSASTIVQNVTNSGHAGSGMQESGGRALNRLLAKSLAADLDNLDYVPNGSTFGRTLLTALTSGQIDLSKAGVISKFLTELVRSSGDATSASTIVQFLTNGGHASSSMQESGGRALNRLLAKALSSDSDNLDYVPNGSSYGRTLLTALTSGQVDLANGGVIGKHAGNLVRSGGDGTVLGTIIQYLTNGGHAGASMQESGGRTLSRLLAKALAADLDNLDYLPNGSTYGRTTLNQVTGAGRAFSALDSSNQLTTAVTSGATIDGTAASTVKTGAVRANTGLDSSGNLVADISGNTDVISGDLYIGTSNRAKFGTQGSPQSLTKTVRLHVADSDVGGNTYVFQGPAWGTNLPYRRVPGSTTSEFVFPIVVSPGSTLTQFRLRCIKGLLGDTLDLRIFRTTDGAMTQLASTSLSATAWTTLSVSLSETVSVGSNDGYFASVYCTSSSAGSQVWIAWAEFDYTVPDYATSL